MTRSKLQQRSPSDESIGGRSDGPFSLYPTHYAPPPVPPSSLAALAVSELDDSVDTLRNVRRGRSNPALRTGLAIVVTGAFIGGMFGVAQRIQQRYSPDAVNMQASSGEEAIAAPPPAIAMTSKADEAPTAQPTSEEALGVVVPVSSPAPLVLVTSPRTVKSPTKRVAQPRLTPSHAGAKGKAIAEEPKSKEPKTVAAKRPARGAEAPTDGEAEGLLKAAMGATENTL